MPGARSFPVTGCLPFGDVPNLGLAHPKNMGRSTPRIAAESTSQGEYIPRARHLVLMGKDSKTKQMSFGLTGPSDLRRRCWMVLLLPQPGHGHHQARGRHAGLKAGGCMRKNGFQPVVGHPDHIEGDFFFCNHVEECGAWVERCQTDTLIHHNQARQPCFHT